MKPKTPSPNGKNNRNVKKGFLYSSLFLILLGLVFWGIHEIGKEKNPVTSYELQKIQGYTQGGLYQITIYDTLMDWMSIKNGSDSILRQIDLNLSIHNPHSLLSKINRGEMLRVTPLFQDIFLKSQSISELTQGYFDISIAPVVQFYGFHTQGPSRIPDERQRDSLLQLVGYTRLQIKDSFLYKENAKMQLDFNAIAQGYSADLLGRYLESLGIQNYLIDVGSGEIRCRGHKNENANWSIGIEKPAPTADAPRMLFSKIHLRNQSIATSGNSRKFIEMDGERYAHTLLPFTAQSTKSSLLSCSVVHPQTWAADALATAFMGMGVQGTQDWAKTHAGDSIGIFMIFSTPENTLDTWENEVWKNLY